MDFVYSLFHIDNLSFVMMGLVGFVALCTGKYAHNYLEGDKRRLPFFVELALLTLSVGVMVCADNVFLLLACWAGSNLLLVRLMIHKASWHAARQSGVLALRNFYVGFLALGAALAIVHMQTGENSIQIILIAELPLETHIVLAALLFVAAMTQSALWPFHKWLISSLNSPTPVSALMHAGLVNGGGFLLARFAPVFLDIPYGLNAIFMVGCITAMLGTLWKLVQSDIKRMLACSTMSQMGFMIMQCGLGFFAMAITHLCWHGLFKAYLFMSSPSSAQEKRLDLHYPPSALEFVTSLICGAFGATAFAWVSHKPFILNDTTFFLLFMVFLLAIQFALPMLREKPLRRLPLAITATGVMAALYGLSVHSLETFLAPLYIDRPQPLTIMHIAGFCLMVSAWLGMLFMREPHPSAKVKDLMAGIYVAALNASQPHPRTVTAHRNHYHFL